MQPIHFIRSLLARFFRKGPATFEQKLEILARCGLELSPPFHARDFLESWTRKDFEKPGFNLVLVGLGMPEEREPWRNHCVNVWHFDTECIEGPGSYSRIAERMKEMARGSLPIENIRDDVSDDGSEAWLAFDCRGKAIRIECEVNSDWVDSEVFGHFVRILAESDPDKIYVYYDLGGQDCILACVTRLQLEQLKANGVDFSEL
ncbi:MAG: hypothetical protein HY042_08035, partial [Spirochaetia bacterium]|nr:hypothetical protein [Spirochaetia bacterium]